MGESLTLDAAGRLAGEHLPDEVAKRVVALAKRSIRLARTDHGPSVGRLGGSAVLRPGQDWPRWGDRPLSVVAVLALDDLPRLPELELPSSGWLTFFYDAEEQGAWGYDPSEREGWRVVYADSGGDLVTPPPGTFALAEFSLRAEESWSLPSPEEDVLADLKSEHHQALWDLEEAVREWTEPAHQIGGWPDLIQNPFWLPMQLAANGIYVGNPDGYQHPRVPELSSGAGEWQLLLQVATDDEAGLMWGDDGNIFFGIRGPDLARRVFDECWFELQCC